MTEIFLFNLKFLNISSLCYLWGALHLSAHSNHRQQLQQVLREGQDRGGDPGQEEEILVGRYEEGHRAARTEVRGERTAVLRII